MKGKPVVSVMLAVEDAARAADWYCQALDATVLWDLGTVVGLEVHGATFFIAEPAGNGWATPQGSSIPRPHLAGRRHISADACLHDEEPIERS